MNRRLRIAAATLLLSTTALAGEEYTITDLGANATPVAINDSGLVVGKAGSLNVVWTSNGTPTTLSFATRVTAINNAATVEIVGGASSDGGEHPASWGRSGGTPVLWTHNPGWWVAVNDLGDKIGVDTFSNTPLLSSPDLSVPGLSYFHAIAINNNRKIIGYYDSSTAVGYVDGVLFQVASKSTYPTDINDADVTVGYYESSFLTSSAFVRVRGPNDPPDGVFTTLPPRTATTNDKSRANAINAAGAIVGNSLGEAVIWRSGAVADLNNLIAVGSGWVLKDARDINASGQIVGIGTLGGVSHGYVLTPVTGCPTISVAPVTLPDATPGVPYSAMLSASGGTDPYTFSATSPLPSGFSLSSDGTLSGTPPRAGQITFEITATDANGCTGAQSYTLAEICPAITLGPSLLPDATPGVPYSITLNASGGTGPYSFSLASFPSGFPSGWSLTRDGTLSGTPAIGGQLTFDLKAIDANGCTGSHTYTLDAICPAMTLTPTTLPDGVVGSTYGAAFIAAGGTGPYYFYDAAGNIPPGLSVESNGALVGTPTTSGSFTFAIAASDAHSCAVSRGYTVNVSPAGAVTVPVSGATVTLTEVVTLGETTSTPSDSGPLLPDRYQAMSSYVDLQTTATYSGAITVCLAYQPAGLSPDRQGALRLLHYVGAEWVDITTRVDVASSAVCGVTTSLSPFVVALPPSGYLPAGTMCLGELGHEILSPIRADGLSVFKQGSTVPAKFRVCNSAGVSVGTAGVVSSFRLVTVVQGTATTALDNSVISTTPDSAFRWDVDAAQWVFNVSTHGYAANSTYVFRITLDDGSTIDFRFGLR